MRAFDGGEVATDLVAVLVEQRRLAHERVETDLPVGGIGVPGGDAQRHLLAPAADPELGAGLHRLRVAERAVEPHVLPVRTSRSPRSTAVARLERLVEQRRAGRVRRGKSKP